MLELVHEESADCRGSSLAHLPADLNSQLPPQPTLKVRLEHHK